MEFIAAVIDAEGKRAEERLQAPDRFAAYRMLRERGSTVVELAQRRSAASIVSWWGIARRVSLDERVVFVRSLAAMLDAGLTVSRALSVMERQTKNPVLTQVISAIIASVKRGDSFAAALAPYERVFSPLMVSMARAGEESGTLAEALRSVAVQTERASALEKRVKGALIYPSIVLVAMVAIGVLMLVYVVPTLSATFAELHVALPPTTLVILSISAFLTGHAFLAAAAALLAAAAAWLFARSRTGRRFIDWALLRIPAISSIVIETDSARTARTLSSLLAAGVDMVSSLAITRDVVGNCFFKEALAEAERMVVKGMPLSDSFAHHAELYPPLLSEMVAVGEETGRLSRLLSETASFFEESVERTTKDLSSIVEPVLILLVGGMVAFFAISMIGPIYSLSGSIG